MVRALALKGAKLTVFITDTCNVPLEGSSWIKDEIDRNNRNPPAIQPGKRWQPVQRDDESDEAFAKRKREAREPLTNAMYILPTRDAKALAEFKKGVGPGHFRYLMCLHSGFVDVSGTAQAIRLVQPRWRLVHHRAGAGTG